MLKKLSGKLGAKFPATTLSCSMVKIGHLDESSWNLFNNPKQAQEKANHSNSKKKKQGKKERGKKIQKSKSLKP